VGVLRAILISAGKGTRLMPLTRNTPKCLLQIGNGSTIIEAQLDTLKNVGITKVSIITGYLTEQVEAKIKNAEGIEIDIIYNPFYEEYNNLYSLWMAKYRMDEEIITINGDDLFNEELLTLLMKKDEDIIMTISRKDEYDDDDMKVIVYDNHVKRIGKDIPDKEANGESVGIIKYSKRGTNILKNKLEQMVKSQKYKESFYLEALQNLIEENIYINYQEVMLNMWQEMDFHADYELINKMINDKYMKLQ
jgi:L-glutamine-phosphate cytidylyltransferase